MEKIDFEAKSIKLAKGAEHKYDHLILATGSSPSRLPIEGANLSNVFVLRTVDHAAELVEALGDEKGEKKNLVVIGSSFIGLEAALAASGRENVSVSVVGVDDVPFQAILGKEIGAGIRKVSELSCFVSLWSSSLFLSGAGEHSPGNAGINFALIAARRLQLRKPSRSS